MNNLFPKRYEIEDLNSLISIFLIENYKHKNELSRKNAFRFLKFLINKNAKYIDLDEINDFVLKNDKWNQNTKRLAFSIFSTFFNWVSRVKNIYINTKYLKKLNPVPSKKEEYTFEELEIIKDVILNVFKNKTLYFWWEMMIFNGCRLGEMFLVDWKKIKHEGHNQTIMALKNGNSRTIMVPDHIIDLLDSDDLNLNVKIQTVKNWFSLLQKAVKANYPNWYKPISSHCPRVHRATYSYLNGMSSTEISVMYGSKNFHTFQGTYIKGKRINGMLLIRANQNPLHLLNNLEKDQEIIKLRKLNELQKFYISQLENGNRKKQELNYEKLNFVVGKLS